MFISESIASALLPLYEKKYGLHFGIADLSVVLETDKNLFAESLSDSRERDAYNRIRNPWRRLCRMGGREAAYEALGKYYRCKPRNWTILNTSDGAPFLPGDPGVRLSIAHSPEYAVAVAGPQGVGIDLERIEKRPESLLRYFFSEREQEWIQMRQGWSKDERLHILWTRKEAVSKLLRKGGQLPFRDIAVLDEMSPYTLKSEVSGDHVLSIALYGEGTDRYE